MVLLIRIVQVNFAWQFIQSKILFGGYMVYETMCWEDTFNLGKKIGQQAKPRQVICLNGDLGVGKTVFTQGFAKGLGIEETVNSPTFTIIQVYDEGRIPLYHFDVYRIGDPEEMYEIGYEDYFFGEGVCLIEWSKLIEELIPSDAATVLIEKDLEKGLDYRKVTVEGL
jgi:tRNA threonylcarbamoyladenosine biosynthesis protein TsaE